VSDVLVNLETYRKNTTNGSFLRFDPYI
jgi:hypothetical protein